MSTMQNTPKIVYGAVSLSEAALKNTTPGSVQEPGVGVKLRYETKNTQVEYTAYGTEYQVCLPLNIEKIIPSDEPVRLLSAVLEELDYRKLAATYSGEAVQQASCEAGGGGLRL